MRKIKFRAWDKLTNSYPFVGFHIIGEIMMFNCIEQLIIKTTKERKERFGHSGIIECYDDFILEQYTGLKDKNGKEIYEGDIVVYRDTSGSGRPREFEPRKIRWHKDSCNFNLSSPMGDAEIEVAGNIHENKELLD